MIARLYCKTGALAGSEFRIDEEAVIGRGEENDITLPSKAVSEEHAHIYFDDETDCYVLEDLDSRNGTWLDDAEVDHPVRMRDLHVITFAGTLDFIFHVVEEVPASAAPEASRTQFGEAPQAPSLSSEGDASEAEQTQFGEAPGDLPDLSGKATSSETDSDSSDDDESTVERTQFGDLPGAPPDVSDDDPSTDTEGTPSDEDDESDVEHTQFGEPSGPLPDAYGEEPASESEEDSPGDELEEARTQFGDRPGAPPDPSADEHRSDPDEDPVEDANQSGPDSSSSAQSEPVDDGTSGGDRTQLGRAPGTLPDLPADDPSSPDEADGPDREDPPAEEDGSTSEASTPYVLHLTPLEGDEETHPLPTGTVTVGRSPECDIHIDDPGISRRHAELIVEEDDVVLKDLESKNFTYVDEERLTEPVTVSPGTEIKFGLQLKAELRRIDR